MIYGNAMYWRSKYVDLKLEYEERSCFKCEYFVKEDSEFKLPFCLFMDVDLADIADLETFHCARFKEKKDE